MSFLLQIAFITALIFVVPALIYLVGRRFSPRLCRRIAYETHLWLGIVAGLILFVVCLSGTLLTFKTETIRFVEKDRYYVTVPKNQDRKTLEELVPAIEKELGGTVIRVTIPDAADRSWVFNVRKNETSGGKTTGMPAGMPAAHAMLGGAYLVDPYTGESLGHQRSGTYMFFIMLQMLHRFLLLPIKVGQLVVGTATLVFIVLIVGGLFLWLPAKLGNLKGWALGLKVRRGKGWSRFLYDTHNTLGFYALIPLMAMALTGPVISFAWYRDAAGKVLGTKPFEKAFEKPMTSSFTGTETQNLAWDDFLAKAAPHLERHGPRPGFTQLYLPQKPESAVTVRKTGEGFCTMAATDKIQFDRYTGEVLKADLFDDFSFGEKVSTLIFQLHNGEIFGTVSKIVYFAACLIATSLPLTGVILWIGKLRTRRRTRIKSEHDASASVENHRALADASCSEKQQFAQKP